MEIKNSERDLPEILTVDQVARVLRLNRKTVYQNIASGELPVAFRLGRAIRISKNALINWLESPKAF